MLCCLFILSTFFLIYGKRNAVCVTCHEWHHKNTSKRRIPTRSAKGNQPLNIKTAMERPILNLGYPNFRLSFYFILLHVASPLFRRIFMTSHITLSSASYPRWKRFFPNVSQHFVMLSINLWMKAWNTSHELAKLQKYFISFYCIHFLESTFHSLWNNHTQINISAWLLETIILTFQHCILCKIPELTNSSSYFWLDISSLLFRTLYWTSPIPTFT